MRTVWRLLVEEPKVTLPWMSDCQRIAIGWGEIGDIRGLGTQEAIADAIRERNETHPKHADKWPANIQHGSHSLHDFCYALKPGDLVIVSDRSCRRSVWEVVGDYEYVQRPGYPRNYQHQRLARPVKMDPDVLWRQAGGKLQEGQINYRTLGRCADGVE